MCCNIWDAGQIVLQYFATATGGVHVPADPLQRVHGQVLPLRLLPLAPVVLLLLLLLPLLLDVGGLPRLAGVDARRGPLGLLLPPPVVPGRLVRLVLLDLFVLLILGLIGVVVLGLLAAPRLAAAP